MQFTQKYAHFGISGNRQRPYRIVLRFARGQVPPDLDANIYWGNNPTPVAALKPTITPVQGRNDIVIFELSAAQMQQASPYSGALYVELSYDGMVQARGPVVSDNQTAVQAPDEMITFKTVTGQTIYVFVDEVLAQMLEMQNDVTGKLGQVNTAKQHVDQQVIHVDQQAEHVDEQVEHIDDQREAIDQLAEQTADDRQATNQDRQAVASDKQTVADNLNLTNQYKNSAYNSAVAAGTSEDNAEASAQTATSKAAEAAASAESAADSLGQVEVLAGQTADDRQATNQDRQQVASDKQTVADNLSLTNQYKNSAYNSAVAAGTSETNAKTSETNAAASALLAQQERIAAQENRYRYMGSWAPNTDYIVGDGVLYGNSFYRRKTAGNSGATFIKANWDLLAAGVNPRGSWAANTSYLLNELVVFRRSAYLATTDFTSGSTFSRANWLRLFSGWNPTGQWQANTQYYEDDIVRNAGSSYRVTTDHVSGATFSASNLESVADKGDPGTLTASAFPVVSLPLVSTDKIVIQRGDNTMGKIDPFTTGFPDIRPSVLFDFANSRIVSPRLIFSRNTPVARFNAAGNLEAVGANVPRINHDYLTKRCLGYLAEDSRQIFAFGGMASVGIGSIQSGLTATVTATGTEYGMTYKDVTISGTATTGGYTNITWGNNPVTAGTAYTSSVFTKIISGSFQIESMGSLGGAGFGTYAPNTPTTTTLKRLWVTGTPTSNNTLYPCWGCYLPIGVASNLVIRFYAPQVEVGSFPTSPLLTTTTVTRALDFCRLPISSSWFNPEEGTMFVEVQHSISIGAAIACGIGGGALDGIYIRQNPTVMTGMFRDDALPAQDVTGGAWTAGTIARYVMSYKNGSPVRFYMIGVSSSSSVNYTTAHSNSWTYMSIGCFMDGNGPFNGHILKFAYWPKQLTDAQAQTLVL